MYNLYFEKKEQFTSDEILSFFEGYKQIEKKLILSSLGAVIVLFSLGWLLDGLGVNFAAIFFGFVAMAIGLTTQITKLSQTMDDNEKNIIKNIATNSIIAIVESDNLDQQHKKMILGLIPKRKLEYAMSFTDDFSIQMFIMSVSETLQD